MTPERPEPPDATIDRLLHPAARRRPQRTLGASDRHQPPAAVDQMLARARARLDRVGPAQAERLRQAGALLVDIRPLADRAAEGEIPGAVPVERIVLEWRLDPRSPHRLPGITPELPVVIFCNEGYASSLAARDAIRLGLRHATDLIGGYRAWAAAALPTDPGGTPAVP